MKPYKRHKIKRHDREQKFNPAFVPNETARTKCRHKSKRAVRGLITRLQARPLRGWNVGELTADRIEPYDSGPEAGGAS